MINLKNPVVAHFIGNSLCTFSDIMTYGCVILRMYRIMLFTKITFDQLPLFNPYKWPLSIIRIITTPYFRFWSKLIPTLKLGKYSFNISTMVSIEVLSIIIFSTTKIRIIILAHANVLLNV